MEEIVNLVVQNGLGVACVAYLMWFQSTIMNDMQKTLTNINTTLTSMDVRLSQIEDRTDNHE